MSDFLAKKPTQRTLVLDDDEIEKPKKKMELDDFDEKEVMKSINYFGNPMMNDVKSELMFSKRLKKYKLNVQNGLKGIQKLETKIFHIVQAAEDYFTNTLNEEQTEKIDELKKELIMSVIENSKKDEVYTALITVLQKDIIKTTFSRRSAKRIYKILDFFLKMFVKTT